LRGFFILNLLREIMSEEEIQLSRQVMESWDLPVGYERLEGKPDDWRRNLGVEGMNAETIQIATEHHLPPICLPSASETIGAYQGEVDFIERTGTGIGIDPAIVTRDASLAPPGSIIVGRSAPWEQCLKGNNDVIPLELENTSYYYTMEALLHTAKSDPTKLQILVKRLKEAPKTPINIYTLDEPTEIFLLWLQKQAELDQIYVNANSREIAECWNSKHILYPPINTLDTPGQLQSQYQYPLPTLPGIHIRDVSGTLKNSEQLMQVIKFFGNRGINAVCVKPCRGTDGSRILTNIPLEELHEVLNRPAYNNQNTEVVIEPHISYTTVSDNSGLYPLALSAHIIDGEVPPQITLQLMGDGGEWRGNLSLDEDSISEFGITQKDYKLIQKTMRAIAQNLTPLGLIRGGVDWAIGTIDGTEDRICAPTDPNLRANGGALMHQYLRRQRERSNAHGIQGGIQASLENIQVCTRVIKPASGVTHQEIEKAIQQFYSTNEKLNQDLYSADTIAVVPPGWGMIGTTAESSKSALHCIMEIEKYLREQNLVN
jgi:hypothetical protein